MMKHRQNEQISQLDFRRNSPKNFRPERKIDFLSFGMFLVSSCKLRYIAGLRVKKKHFEDDEVSTKQPKKLEFQNSFVQL